MHIVGITLLALGTLGLLYMTAELAWHELTRRRYERLLDEQLDEVAGWRPERGEKTEWPWP